MATITGTSGNDSLVGTTGNDTISGLGGNDTLNGNGGTDFYDGGAGSDTLDFRLTATGVSVSFSDGTVSGGFSGTFASIERVLGGNGTDIIIGAAGAQNLSGRAGDDTLAGATGVDTLWGGAGNDRFIFREYGTADADRVSDFTSGQDKLELDAVTFSAIGGEGNFNAGDPRFAANSTGTAQDASDRVIFQTGTGQVWYDADGNGSAARQLIATLQSGATLTAADIIVVAGPGGAVITGTPGDDMLEGTPGDDTIDGLGGNDTLRGWEGADSIRGGDGNDVLYAYHHELMLDPSDGAADTLDGGLGDDEYHVGEAVDIILDSGGIDTVVAGTDWTLGAGLENLELDGLVADGTGNELDNRILSAHEGGAIFGMGGNDTLIIRGSENGTSAHGGHGDDSLFGHGVGIGGISRLFGEAGNDLLTGGGSDTTMDGGAGNDTLSGGATEYAFSVAPGAANADLILEFSSGDSTIELDGAVHVNSGPSGRFASDDARFAANATGTAHDTSDRVIYHTGTGQLWYDADGNGSGSAHLIATLEGAPTLVAGDISIVNGSASGSVINGTSGNDTLIGTDGDDTINGLGGNDSLTGAAGSDELNGGDGNDTLNGWLTTFGGETVAETMDGGLGDDLYRVDHAGDVLADAGGVDTVQTWDLDWTLGSSFEHLILSTDGFGRTGIGNDLGNMMTIGFDGGRLEGRGGNDTLVATHHASELLGEDGNDSLVGDWSDDTLDGGAGNDTLRGGSMFDDLTGGAGADVFILDSRGVDDDGFTHPSFDTILDFASGSDHIQLDAAGAFMAELGMSGTLAPNDPRFHAGAGASHGHDSSDRLIYDTTTGRLWFDRDGSGVEAPEVILEILSGGSPGELSATDITIINGSTPSGEVINGTSGNDTLTGTAGNDTINGLGGNDLFLAGSTGGADVIDGGAGSDSIEFKARATSPVVVDYGAGTITGGSSGSISFTSIERIVTGNFDDRLTGNAAGQNLTGQAGADTLAGAGGIDALWGGSGNDVFIFREMGSTNADRLPDFASGQDELQLDAGAFTAIGAMGNFAADDARFWASGSGAAHDANDRVTYNTSTGQLYYDADGNGSGAAQLIATLTGIPTIAATDIAVI